MNKKPQTQQIDEITATELRVLIDILFASGDLIDDTIFRISELMRTDDKKLRLLNYEWYAKFDRLQSASKQIANCTRRLLNDESAKVLTERNGMILDIILNRFKQ